MAIGYIGGAIHVVYAAATNNLYKWDVEAMRWIVITPPTTFVPLAVATIPTNPSVVYCGTYGDGIYKSEDGGNT